MGSKDVRSTTHSANFIGSLQKELLRHRSCPTKHEAPSAIFGWVEADMTAGADKPGGLVRVYESFGTPHVVRGTGYVRSVAQDRRYEARGVDTQAALLAIAQRGRDGVQRARDRFLPGRVPLAERAAGVSTTWRQPQVEDTRVALRAAPVTSNRLEDWAVSDRGSVLPLGPSARQA
jgi:hypothetical protein